MTIRMSRTEHTGNLPVSDNFYQAGNLDVFETGCFFWQQNLIFFLSEKHCPINYSGMCSLLLGLGGGGGDGDNRL